MTKSLSEATEEDFERSKVWVCKGDSDDVAIIESSSKTELLEDDGSVYLTATQFQLADGTVLTGFSSPTDDSGIDYVQPVMFHDGSQVTLWTEDDGMIDVSAALGKKTSDVYPIHWISEVRVDGEERKGDIDLL